MDDLANLKPVFQAMGEGGFDAVVLRGYPMLERIKHVHTAANSVDGACACCWAIAALASAMPSPRAKLRACVSCGSEPLISLGGPMPATERVLAAAGMGTGDIDLFEVNEAFAVVPLCYQQAFGVDDDKINVGRYGGDPGGHGGR